MAIFRQLTSIIFQKASHCNSGSLVVFVTSLTTLVVFSGGDCLWSPFVHYSATLIPRAMRVAAAKGGPVQVSGVVRDHP
jgi:hypothetical protein